MNAGPTKDFATLAVLSTALFSSFPAAAAPPEIIHHQGRFVSGGTNFDGTAFFKFALVDAVGATTYWSNDATSAAGSEPTAAVSLAVTNGLYSVGLGDVAITNMTNSVPAMIFDDQSEVYLRIWIDDGVNGSLLMNPDQRITSVGYALAATNAESAETIAGFTIDAANYQTAWGEGATATGNRATAWGLNNSSPGVNGTAWGSTNTASGLNATAFGFDNVASSNTSTAWGVGNDATNISSTAFGNFSLARRQGATAWGTNTIAGDLSTGNWATAWGRLTRAFGNRATAFGNQARATGVDATAFGDNTDATADRATAWGIQSEASAVNATAFGVSTVASGERALAFGNFTEATGNSSTAFGHFTDATAARATAFGSETEASAIDATAWGRSSTASGEVATALGHFTEAESFAEVTLGRFDTDYTPASTTAWDSTDRLLVIGNGIDDSNRNDALVMLKNGDTTLDGDLLVNGRFGAGTTTVGDLLASEVVTSGDFKYDAPRTFTKLVSGAAFVPKSDAETFLFNPIGFIMTRNAGNLFFRMVAPVELPVGATVTTVDFLVYDNDPVANITDLDCRLLTRIVTDPANEIALSFFTNQTTSGTDPAIQKLTDTTIVNPVVTADRIYTVDVDFEVSAFTSDCRFYGVIISYTLDTLSP